MKRIIDINKFLPSTITSRDAMEVLKDQFSTNEEVTYVLNFDGIDFVSRAFADELIHFLERNKFSFQFISTTSLVSEMITTVQRNRRSKNKSFHEVAITRPSDQEELNNFLSLI